MTTFGVARAGEAAFGRPQGRLPIFAGFGREILPVLVALWAVLLVLFLVTGQAFLWAVLPWSTVTVMMLWPVGHALGRSYLSYRTPGFSLGVLSMAYIIFTGFAMTSDWPFLVKSLIFWGLALDLTIFGIIPSLRAAISRPVPMFFKPDLLFGDGRVLCCGTIALVLGLRYLIGSPAMGVAWPVPKWDWYAIFFAMVLGFIPLIAVRGVLKLLLRMRRLRDDRWTGWGSTILREGLLVVTLLALGYGFHHAFLGAQPFTLPVSVDHPDFWPALLITLAGAAFLIFVRGGYKRAIGDPFIVETPAQTLIKQLLFVAGALVLYYGLMSLVHMDPMHIEAGVSGLRRPENMGLYWAIGLPLVLWGLAVLVPFRVLAQHVQRQAIVAQMAAVILPSFSEEQRRRVLGKMQDALADMLPRQRQSYLRAMNEGIASAPEESRASITRTYVGLLVQQPPERRDRLMRSMAAALWELPEAPRVTRMADMMGAVAELPAEQRRLMIEQMASLLR